MNYIIGILFFILLVVVGIYLGVFMVIIVDKLWIYLNKKHKSVNLTQNWNPSETQTYNHHPDWKSTTDFINSIPEKRNDHT